MLRLLRGALAAGVLGLALAGPAAADVGFMRAWGTVGSGDGQFALPDGLDVDNGGTVWVADRDNNRLERFTTNGRFLPFPPFRHQHRSHAPGRLNVPYDIAPDPLGNLYVADTHNDRIQEFSPTGRLIRKWGRRGSAAGQFWDPRGVAVDPFGNVWVADHENKRVQKFTSTGRFLGKFGANGGDGTLGGGWGEFNSPRGLSSDAEGNIYVADDANHRIVKMDNDGHTLAMWGRPDLRPGTGDGEFTLPYGTAVDRFGHLWVADTNNHRIVEMTTDGAVIAKYGAHGGNGDPGNRPGQFKNSYNVAVDCAGNVYATDKGNWRVQKFGDPSFGRPVCPPRVSVGAVKVAGRVVSGDVTCDRPCRARAIAVRGGRRVAGRGRVLRFGGVVRVAVRVPAALAGRRVKVRFSGSGAPGAVRSVVRSVRF
ncbi:MAG: tripartite motif-containing protein 71 [Thermoleophilaceae bacterium]|nr:tripartite motif-containing protein 71 [Thermoleophilaceae bacterium]